MRFYNRLPSLKTALLQLSFSYRIFIFLLNMSYFFCIEYLFNLCYYSIEFMWKNPVKKNVYECIFSFKDSRVSKIIFLFIFSC